MADAVAVEEKHLGPDLEPAERLLDERAFPEGQEPGDIGKVDCPAGLSDTLQAELWIREHRDNAAGAARHPTVCDIDSSHVRERGERIGQDPLRAETLLECARLFRRYRPSMPGHGDTVSEERLSEKQEKKYRETDG